MREQERKTLVFQRVQGSDLTFIVNDTNTSLKERFNQLLKDCRFFDCMVGYFYVSGFHRIYRSLENAERIRILIGIATNRETYDLINSGFDSDNLSHAEVRQIVPDIVADEISNSDDGRNIEEGILKFIEWIRNGKIQIRAHPYRNLHAKLYIITFKEGDRDVGRVITGSSNFTASGLKDNLEFNVELKNRSDYEFAIRKFEELWESSVELSDKYVQTITERTYINKGITPYELYLKFLYEYFNEELSETNELYTKHLPQNFRKLEYQRQAVLNAKKILEEYGGVFISDVVGLGKTYITAMLVGQLEGRTLVIAPPSLLNKNNPGSWPNVFEDFGIPAKFVSIGKLDEAIEAANQREYKNIVIDESHRFRNEMTIRYEKVAQICRGKRVILVSATPYNNHPIDLLNQIKLFQSPRKSNIPGLPNIEKFFVDVEKKLAKYDPVKDYDSYLKVVSQNAKEIREKVLKYMMVRRTRSEIEKYFSEDLEKNKISFPKIEDPKPIYYQLDNREDEIFMKTVKLITQDFRYARYSPLLYLIRPIKPLEQQAQRNLAGFMKVLLVKRLESSFYAFRRTIERFTVSYEKFIKAFKKGYVYVRGEHAERIFEILDQDDDQQIQKIVDEGKSQIFNAKDFTKNFLKDLEHDLKILRNIGSMWDSIERDPKFEKLLTELKNDPLLKNSKIIIFTESKETAEYLADQINKKFAKDIALTFHSRSPEKVRNIVIQNFDARAAHKRDDYRILVSTDILSEGVNLHRANIVMNYDIPWNPTKLMQRVGRVNRIDTSFKKIYTFNFFPTVQADTEIELMSIARKKIEEFLTMLGGDSLILTEGEPVSSHELFDKLLLRKTIVQEEEEWQESELKYLKLIKEIRDSDPDLFQKIKQLPKKARTAKAFDRYLKDVTEPDSLITFFRKGKIMKFFISNKKETKEVDFLTAAKIFESSTNEGKKNIPINEYYELLDKNKIEFSKATLGEIIEVRQKGGTSTARELLKILKATLRSAEQLTEDQEKYLRELMAKLEEGDLPKKTLQNVMKELKILGHNIQDPLKVINVLQKHIPRIFFEKHYAKSSQISEKSKVEVILSLYLTK